LAFFGIVFSTLSAHCRLSFYAPAILAGQPSSRARSRARGAGRGDYPVGTGAGGAASYSRYSSEHQNSDSIDQQQRSCRDRAVRDGKEIAPSLEFFDEAVSGTKLHRDGFDKMLAAAGERKFDTLYIHDIGRLARESVISMPILKKLVFVDKVRIISVTEGVDSAIEGWETSATIYGLQHEQFIRHLSKNVFRGQEANVLNGYSAGDYCLGFKSVPIDGRNSARAGRNAKPKMRYVVDETEAEWVRRIFDWYVRFGWSVGRIVRKLNAENAPKDHRSSTKKWHRDYVIRLLSNRKYIGEWSWGKRKNHRHPLTGQVHQEARLDDETERWVRHLPDLEIVDRATFDKAQARLKATAAKFVGLRGAGGKLRGSRAGEPASPRHLLAGLIRCPRATFSLRSASL
jgi:site-specific DNA recombinase